MKAIVYQSKATVPFNNEQLDELGRIATAKNALLGVTGYLCFYRRSFFQYIEGDAETVSDLMNLIAADHRHHVLRIHEDDSLLLRRFPAWHMKYISADRGENVELKNLVQLHFDRFDGRDFEDSWVNMIRGAVLQVARLQESVY